MTPRSRSLFAALSLTVAALGCMLPMTPLPSPYTPRYSYEPPTSDAGKGVSIALVNPKLSQATQIALAMSYAKVGQQTPPDLMNADPAFRAFHGSVATSFIQYFTASGFSVSGPFRSVDEMTFPEKKQADLVLTAEFNTIVQAPDAVVSDSLVVTEGKCIFGGTIDLVLWEPLSMQRMWAKSIQVDRAETDCTFTARNASDFNLLIGNATGALYEDAFPSVMATAERYFTPEEVALVKKQSEEIRAGKVY